MIDTIKHVVRFEFSRSRSRGRMVIMMAIALLPALLVGLFKLQVRGLTPDGPVALIAYFLVAQIGCMLGLLLWVTPVVGSEVESQTWVYVAMRERGRISLVLGKFLVAVGWAIACGTIGSILVGLVSGVAEPVRLSLTLFGLVLISSFCYGSLYLLIGVVFTRRSTVFAVVYSLIMEGVVSNIPATINQLTVAYRLRALLVEWTGMERLRSDAVEYFGAEPLWHHFLAVTLFVLITLTISVIIIDRKEIAGEATSA